MRYGYLGSVMAMLTGVSLSLAQMPPPSSSATSSPPAHGQPGTAHPLVPNAPTIGSCCGTNACNADLVDAGSLWDEGGSLGGRFWASAEYLLWRTKNDNVPPLVTTGPASFPVGFLGNPGTVVLFGGDIDRGTMSAARLTAGMWLDCCHTCGIEASFFMLGQGSDNALFTSAGFPVLARPFFNVNSGIQFSEFPAFPGISTGAIAIDSPSRLWGGGVNMRKNLICGCDRRVDWLGGVRYLDLDESITIVETATFLPTAPFPGLAGSSFVAVDQFATRNQFYGGMIGVNARRWRGDWFVDLRGTLSLGVTRQEIEINGFQRITTAAGATSVVPGGLLALPGANIGRFTRNEFSVVPEVGINVGYQLTRNLSVFGGYSFLYWSNVARPGGQIDPNLDINRIPNFGLVGPPVAGVRPTVPFDQTGFWAHGINVGVGLNW